MVSKASRRAGGVEGRCASTSNRNFVGPPAFKGGTHRVSPAIAAADAIAGHFVDVRECGESARARSGWFRQQRSSLQMKMRAPDRRPQFCIPRHFLSRDAAARDQVLGRHWCETPAIVTNLPQASPVVAMVVPIIPMMPAVRPVIADAAGTVVRQDDAAATIGMIVMGRRVIGPVVIGLVEVPMVVVREPVTAVAIAAAMEDMSSAETAALERWSGAETASAAKMGATSAVTAAAKMHPTATVATSATATAVHLRGQAF